MNTEELELLSDSKYRQFINAVEKALKSFEYSSEWADLISALGKLNKVLQNHTKFKVLPRKLTIGKRLAQCMHPTLPSGVHLKALETYELIFKRIGHKGLAQDLFIYSAGLFPLLGNAAMSTRPVLMNMYENYFLPLGKALLPGLPGLLLGLLPGIEEGSEYTDRTISLLGSFSENTDKNIFYTTLWGCIYSSASIRLPAVTFILTRLNKKGAGKQKYLLGNDIHVLVQAVSLALRDSSVLVQRSMLDFLLAFLPVDTNYLLSNEKITLVAAALEVLLRRDMSLNRRLYTWLLGPNGAKNESLSRTDSVCSSDADHEGPTATFFSLHSRPLVIEALRRLFQNHDSADKGDANGSKKAQRLEVLKPFRLLISLLDKPEIGGSILEDVLLDVFRALYSQCKELRENDATFEESDRRDSIESVVLDSGAAIAESAKTKLIDELIKTANLLFNAFEPYFMWEYIAKLLSECDRPPAVSEEVNGVENWEDHKESRFVVTPSTTNCSEVFRLTDFILDVVTLEADVEIQTEHWPELLRKITIEMTKRCETMALEDVKEGICLCSRLLSKVMPSMKTRDKKSNDSRWDAENKDRKNELEGSAEHELKEWSIIDLKGAKEDNKKVDLARENSLESSQEVFVEETAESEDTDGEEDKKIVSIVDSNEKELNLLAGQREGGIDSAEYNEDTQDELDEWSDFQEVESSSELNAVNLADGRDKTLGKSGENMPSKNSEHLFQPSLIQACVKYFQNFFAKFVVERVIKHVNSLRVSNESTPGMMSKECYTALRASGIVSDTMWLQIEKVCNTTKNELVEDACKTQTNLKARRNVTGPTALVASFRSVQSSKNCAEAFAAACKLLLKLSCFPVWGGKDSEQQRTTTDKKEVSKVSYLPDWLQSLIMCCFEVSEFDIQSSAVGTLLDLINLTLSVNAGHAHGPRPPAPVVVIPMISKQSLGVIEKSDLYEVIAESLWGHLKEDTTQFHQRIVELFLQLHNLTPSPSLCANVIGNSLVDISKELSLQGHWKFAVFWHVARNVVIQDSGRSSRLGEFRTLDRALFIMLDSLQNEEPEISVLTQHWLAHALQHGDLGRIIDPLLLLLLHPVTARVSIHYLYSVFDSKIARKMTNALGSERKTSNDVKVHPKTEIGTATSGKQKNEMVRRKPGFTLGNTRESDDSKTTSPSGPSEAEHSTDTDGDGAEADDENEENEPKKGKEKDDLPNQTPQSPPPRKSLVHPLDQHKLLYVLHYDSQLTLYAFSTLQTILMRAPHQFVCASSTTSISSSNTPHQEKIKELLIRHRRSLLGKGFYGALYDSPVSPTGPAHSARLFGGPLIYLKPSTSKYLEVLISVSLYFIRSEYSSHLHVQPEDIDGNVQVQMVSSEFLLGVMWQLVEVVKESGAGFGTYISDMFSRCKVQKALLHCLLSTLYERTGVRTSSKSSSPTINSDHEHISSEISQSQARAFQVKLVKLVQSVFILESYIHSAVAISQETAASHGTPPPSKPESPAKVSGDPKVAQSAHRYIPGKPLAEQGMLLSAVLHGLRHDEPDMHYEWLQFVITCLSHMAMQLRTWVVPVAEHLCRILERLTTVYIKDKDKRSARIGSSDEFGTRRTESDVSNVPPDYVVTLLESLASICHYCLRDHTTPQSPALSLKPRARSNSSPAVGVNSDLIQSSGSSVFTNLLHAFSVQSAPISDVPSVEVPKHILDAREGLLSVLPKILSSLFTVWSTWRPQRADSTGQRLPSECPLTLMGSPKAVQQQILQLLTPVTMNHTIVFLASLADVWYQRRRREGSGIKATRAIPLASEEQIIVVDIVYAIKALSVEDMIDNVKQILRQVVMSKDKTTPTQSGLEVNILQFLYEYLLKASESQLIVVRSSLLSLMKEGLQLNFPPALFLLLVILRSYVQNIPLQEDKKVRKELQDITQRLVEACNTVAGSSLENAAWFRRTLAVIPQQDVASDQSSNVESEISEAEPALPPPPLPSSNTSNTSSYSTQALFVLAEVLAPVLDMVFGSDEKERMTSFLTTVMYNVTPFLKNHSPHNVPSFRACCNLLASLSGYQYTRRAWKKEVMELLLDPNFFQMDISCIGSWRTIIDNLMTQDNTSFKELMTRVAGLSQSASINIFANRELEMDQRAQLLKKLSFTIFCSEIDQYQYALPEIQERLAESLRLPQSPVVHEQIFLFFRVLILRMSAQHLTPLWPTIVSEVVHVLLQMESDLSTDGKSQKQRIAISELLLGSNGFVNYSQEKWLGLYLGVCKLLDLSQALPSSYLSQFQLYRWAFEGEAYNMTAGEEKVPVFKPHIARLEKLLTRKRRDQGDIEELQRVSGQPLLTMYHIKSLDQLLPFFQCLSRNRFENYGESRDKNNKSKSPQGKSLLERVVERDFLEPLVVD